VKDFEIIFALYEMQFICLVEQSRVGLLDHEDEDIMVLKSIRTYSPQ
jgi:hypothetical protein